MPLSPGTRLGPYEIVASIGAGGMGEVYRAKDTRLDRTVAIKILPSHLAENSDAKQRFDREARTVSQLNHPHICTLHDVGHQDGTDYLVMEFVEGETLADRLRKGPLPLEQLLKIGIEICDGLERAHRSGITHRDLKPANIMLTRSGAKLMDFGLAKTAVVATSADAASRETVMETVAANQPLTAHGSIVGTFNYMAPEQVEGKEAGPRSDIFALGAVLYEMATGKRAFQSNSAAGAMAAVMERDPAPISSVQPNLPPALDRLVKSCLAKDPDDRWQTVHDVKLQLKQIQEGGSQVQSQTGTSPALQRKQRFATLGWIVASLFAAIALAAVALAWMEHDRPLPVLRVDINPPEKTSFNVSGDNGGPAEISPDGRYLVFSATNTGGASQLYLRPLDTVAAHPLPGTEGAMFPFWSPDSRSIGFFTTERLMRTEVSGGTPVTICNATLARGGSWSTDGTILAALRYNGGIWRVPATGGVPVEITHVDNLTYSSHRWPQALPDGKHFLYIAVNHDNPASAKIGTFFASIDGTENRLLMPMLSNAIYSDGHLLYLRDNSLLAQPFDPGAGKTTGESKILGERVQNDGTLWRMNLSASNNGMLLLASSAGKGNQKMGWYDRSGKLLEQVAETGPYVSIALSPDEKHVAVGVQSANTATSIYDMTAKQFSRLTYDPGASLGPEWSPDGKQIAFISRLGANIATVSLDNRGQVQTLLQTQDQVLNGVSSWSADGKYILYQQGTGLDQHAWVLPLFGDRKPYPLLKEENTSILWAKFSPDSRWVCYTAIQEGLPSIFVAPFPSTGDKTQVSPGVGVGCYWRGDGKELFFYDQQGIQAAQVDGSGEQFRVGPVHQLFPIGLRGFSQEIQPSIDGLRFLLLTPSDTEARPLTLVQNWTEELKSR